MRPRRIGRAAPLHKRARGEALTGSGVGDDHDFGLEDRVGAEREVTRGFFDRQAEDALEPPAFSVQQGDGGNGGTADLGRRARDVVERRFCRRVEDTAL